MQIVLIYALPLTLGLIMFLLGLGLRQDAFARVFEYPRAYLTGVAAQTFMIPVLAFLAVWVLGMASWSHDTYPTGSLALAVMILALCPGVPMAAVLARFARGDVALSICLTASSALIAILTIPWGLQFLARLYLDASLAAVSVFTPMMRLFMIMTVPLIFGMGFRSLFPGAAINLLNLLGVPIVLLFFGIVYAALIASVDLVIISLTTFGPALILLMSATFAGVWGLARWAQLTFSQTTSLILAVCLQNGTVGMTLGVVLAFELVGEMGRGPLSMAAALYGLFGYLVFVPVAFWRRQRAKQLGFADGQQAADERQSALQI